METNTKKTFIIFLQKIIAVYKIIISPFLGNRCRFAPSCSEYAHQAIEQHGVIKGISFSLKRISRCHPWGSTGYDPVPEPNNYSVNQQSLTKTSLKEVNN